MWKALDLTIVLTILLLNCGKGLCQESYEITTIARWGQLFERHYCEEINEYDSLLQSFYQDSTLMSYVSVQQRDNYKGFQLYSVYLSHAYDSVDFICELENGHNLCVQYLNHTNTYPSYQTPFPLSEMGLIVLYEFAWNILIDVPNQRFIIVNNPGMDIAQIEQSVDLKWSDVLTDSLVAISSSKTVDNTGKSRNFAP